jgi:PAS domain S-box-containing protein
MTKKPTYEELEQRVRELEEESIERKQLEDALKSERDKLKALLDGLARTRIGVDIVSNDYEVLQQNQTLVDRFGNIVGKKCYKEYMALDKPCSFCPMVKALENKRLERAELLGANGRDYEILAAPLTNPDGTVDKAIEVVQDITERRQAEEALRESEKKYRQLFNTVSNAIMLFDAETKEFVDVNDASLKLYGYSKEEFLKLRHFDITAEPEESEDSIKQTISGEITEIPLRYHKRKDGTKFPVEISIGTFVSGNRHILCGVIKDITERKRTEEILQEKEFLIESSSSIIATADLEGNMTYGNPAFLKTWGFDEAEEFLGRPFTEFWVVKDRIDEIMQALQREGEWFSEDKARRKDGTLFDIQVSAATVYDTEGNPIALTSTSIDITERKRTEKALHESEERFRYLTESSPLGVFQTDKDGSVLYLNNKWLAITGMSLQDALGFGWSQALHPEDRPRILAEWERCLEEKIGSDIEFRFVRTSGEIRWVRTRTSPVFSPAGDIISHVGVNEDITDRKQAEKALRQEEEKFRVLVEESPLGISFIGEDTKYKYINTKFMEIFGYTLKDIPTGKEWFKKAYPNSEYRDQVISTWIKDLKDSKVGESRPRIFKVICKNGEEKIIHFKPVTMATGDQFVFYEDITNRQRLEDQLRQSQKMESIGTLAGGIAHDFNNILSPIILHTELVLEDISKEDSLRFSLEEILRASMRAKDLVKQILTFSRQTEQERIPLKISPIVKEALKLLRSSLPSTIEIRQNIEAEVGVVLADPTQIHQILMNIGTNAANAMRERGGVLEISLVDVDLHSDDTDHAVDLEPGQYIKLTVNDTGHGIEPAIMDKIFDPYFTTQEKGKGTGLGLSVVHGIVNSHGGHISAYSEPDKGTRFDVYLPLFDLAEIKAETVSPEKLAAGDEHILLVDDEKQIVDVVQQMLERLGYQVTVRTSSIEALEAFRASMDKFDLVITDMTMPNMTGDKLAEKLMNIRPDIPIILCTGFSEKMSKKRAEALGIKDLLMKPIVKNDLTKTVREVLDKS